MWKVSFEGSDLAEFNVYTRYYDVHKIAGVLLKKLMKKSKIANKK